MIEIRHGHAMRELCVVECYVVARLGRQFRHVLDVSQITGLAVSITGTNSRFIIKAMPKRIFESRECEMEDEKILESRI